MTIPDGWWQPGPEPERTKIERLLRAWASIAKGLNLTERNGAIADYDDELASLIVATARETLDWRENPA